MAEPEPHIILEAILLSSSASLTIDDLNQRLPFPVDVRRMVERLNTDYAGRSFSILETSPGRFGVRTKPESGDLCRKMLQAPLRLTRAAQETLMVVAYFQPVTRSEIEKVRGVALGKGTLDSLIYANLVKPGQRRMTQGHPMTFETTIRFLEEFGFASLDDLPDIERLRTEGLMNAERGIDLGSSFDNEADHS